MCKILLGDGADSSMNKKKKKKTWANKSRDNKKHFILGTVYITRHMEAEIGPLIPFWCESTFTSEKLSASFSGFNQNVPFLPPKTTKMNGERVDTNKEGNLFLSTGHNGWNICKME